MQADLQQQGPHAPHLAPAGGGVRALGGGGRGRGHQRPHHGGGNSRRLQAPFLLLRHQNSEL